MPGCARRCPTGLAQLIHQLLARRPEDRPPTGAGVVKAELARIATRVDDPTATHAAVRVDRADAEPARRWSPAGSPRATGGYRPVQPGPVTPTPSTASQPITGSVRTGRPAGNAVRPDRTPQNSARPRQQPNREVRAAHSRPHPRGQLVVVLLVVAVRRRRSSCAPTSVLVNAPRRAPRPRASPTAAPPPARCRAPASPSLTLYDPDGDGTEQSDDVSRADDGDPATAWATVCYGDRFLGGKSGLGLVADLGEPHSGTITAEIASAPYQVEVLAAVDAIPPTLAGGWTSVSTAAGTEAGTPTASVNGARYVAVLFHELGRGRHVQPEPLPRHHRRDLVQPPDGARWPVPATARR